MHARRERPTEAAAAQPRVPAALRARGRRERRARVPRVELGLQAAASRAKYALHVLYTRTVHSLLCPEPLLCAAPLRRARSAKARAMGPSPDGRVATRQPSRLRVLLCPAALLQRLLALGNLARALARQRWHVLLVPPHVKVHVSARASNARGRGRTNNLLLVRTSARIESH